MTNEDTQEDPIEPLQAVRKPGTSLESEGECILSVEIDTGASRSVMSETQCGLIGHLSHHL